MATYTSFYDNQTLASRMVVNADSPGINGFGVLEYTIDFNLARFGATGAKATTSDILELCPIPIRTQILGVQYDVLTAEGATFTFNLGDTGSATRFVSGGNGNSAGNVMAMVAEASWANTYYSTANTLRLAVATGSNIGTAKLRFVLFGLFGRTNV